MDDGRRSWGGGGTRSLGETATGVGCFARKGSSCPKGSRREGSSEAGEGAHGAGGKEDDGAAAAKVVELEATVTALKQENRELTAATERLTEDMKEFQEELDEERSKAEAKVAKLQAEVEASKKSVEELARVRKNLVALVKENEELLVRIEELVGAEE